MSLSADPLGGLYGVSTFPGADLLRDAFDAYERAIRIIENNYGENDLQLLSPLRRLAKVRILEWSRKEEAEAPLLRILSLIDSNRNADDISRARSLLDLADFYYLTKAKKADETYLEAWSVVQENEKNNQLASSLFSKPTELSANNPPILYLRKQPDNTIVGEELFVSLTYNVLRTGAVKITGASKYNVTIAQVRNVRNMLRYSRFRPRIVDGKIVATEGLQFRQVFKVID